MALLPRAASLTIPLPSTPILPLHSYSHPSRGSPSPQNFITSKNKPDVYDCKLKTNMSKSRRTGKHQHQGFLSLTKHAARGRSNIATAEEASDVTARIRRSDYQMESLSRTFAGPPARVTDPTSH